MFSADTVSESQSGNLCHLDSMPYSLLALSVFLHMNLEWHVCEVMCLISASPPVFMNHEDQNHLLLQQIQAYCSSLHTVGAQ